MNQSAIPPSRVKLTPEATVSLNEQYAMDPDLPTGHSNLMPSYLVSTVLWLLMLGLTTVSAYFAEQPSLSRGLIGVVLLLTVVKAGMIVDYFMNLRRAPRFWRVLLMAYVPLVSLIIYAAYAVDFINPAG